MTGKLEGRVALITGGGTGIGRAIALSFAAQGARAAVCGRRAAPLEAVVAAIESAGGEAIAVTADVAQVADCERLVATCAERFGGLDILVNNAGLAQPGSLVDTSIADVDAMIDVDLKGPILVTRAAIPHLAKSGAPSVLNISSSVTQKPLPNYSVYSAAKAGLEMLTRCWALELAEQKIRVNAICPGVVRTPIFESMMPRDEIDSLMAQFDDMTPLGRVGEPEDIARLALHLSSADSEWMTGAIIVLDGGLSLAS